MELLRLLQDSAFSTWIRESSWAIFAFLIIHTLSMGFLAGTGAALCLRVLGVARQVPLSRLPAFFPVMWTAFAFAAVSGAGLVTGYPAKALTNPLFYVKLTILVAAAVLTDRLARQLFADPRYDIGRTPPWAKWTAGTCLTAWVCVIVAGRFLAYTHKVLLVY